MSDRIERFFEELVQGCSMTVAMNKYSDFDVLSEILDTPSLRKRLDDVLKIRAIRLAEESLDVARNATKESAAADKLHVDTIKWLCTSVDPDRFSLKPTDSAESGDHVIITGIVRRGDLPPEEINEDHIHRLRSETTSVEAPSGSEAL